MVGGFEGLKVNLLFEANSYLYFRKDNDQHEGHEQTWANQFTLATEKFRTIQARIFSSEFQLVYLKKNPILDLQGLSQSLRYCYYRPVTLLYH